MTAYQPTPIDLTPHDPTVGAGLLAKAAWQVTQLDGVHIHCCGNGHLGFRPDGGSLLKSAKVSKTLLPHHSAPRLGSVCPNTGLNPWAAATRHPWRGAANPASCRVTHEFKPAFGQRGLTGRLRSRSKADQEQERLASHRGYRWLWRTAQLYRYLWPSQASQLPHLILSVRGIWFLATYQVAVLGKSKVPRSTKRMVPNRPPASLPRST